MTPPTQAQIEAAAKALCNTACNADCWHEQETQAEERDHWIGLAKTALTAAAQVGETAHTDLTRQQLVDEIFKLHDENEKLENTTIERCAQLVESFGGHNVPLIAAAIRKLKD